MSDMRPMTAIELSVMRALNNLNAGRQEDRAVAFIAALTAAGLAVYDREKLVAALVQVYPRPTGLEPSFGEIRVEAGIRARIVGALALAAAEPAKEGR